MVFWGKIVEGIWKFGLEKRLSVESLLSGCENLENNAQSSADDGGLVSEETLRALKDYEVIGYSCKFKSRIWSAG